LLKSRIVTTAESGCPWCGQLRVHGVPGSPDGNQWYRCGACRTTFFIHVPPRLAARAIEPMFPAADAAARPPVHRRS